MFNDTFYPTPRELINKMLEGIDFRQIDSVLEPSGGKGDIIGVIKEQSHKNLDIDTIEINENLRHILQGKGYRVVHDDFLTYNTFKKYSVIIMNPPFDRGDKHLLKAIDMQQDGGKIICLLNAETLWNPFSNTRKDLVRKLEEYDAEVEFIDDGFIDAERITPVQVALIKIDIPRKVNDNSVILDNLRQQENNHINTDHSNSNALIDADFIEGIIQQYNFEVQAGLKLIAEYEALKPLMLNDFDAENLYRKPVLKLSIRDKDRYDENGLHNDYIEGIRMKYWKALFSSKEFTGMFTSNLQEKYYNMVQELKDYDFSYFNIQTLRIQLSKEMIQGVEDTILALFDEFSHKYNWQDETSKNIHYYNGWKTNSAFKVNKRVVTRLNAYNWGRFEPAYYATERKLFDIEKVFNYLDGGKTEHRDITNVLKQAQNENQTKKIKLKYFLVTFYKKGTCHIEFRDKDLLHKFNLYGSQRKGWLPPSYGKAKYNDMTQEEKDVIDEFEGEKSYKKVMDNRDYFIVDSSKLLAIA